MADKAASSGEMGLMVYNQERECGAALVKGGWVFKGECDEL